MNPSNPAPIDMRHTKLKPEEAALLAGELVKPSWASRNEGIHERVSFEDTLWGFEMAGGAYYKTPLRITYVKPDSRAEKACIRMGDTVLRINGQDTSTLTLKEAHELVLESGINLKIVVTSPEDQVNAHYDYQDPIMESPSLTPEQMKEMELERVRKALERASHCRQLQWPWVRRKWIIYRESNCFMVPSKYENKHRDKFPELPTQKIDYFFPVEKTNSVKDNKNVKVNESNEKENKSTEELADKHNAEIEEEKIDEEVEEEVEVEEEIEEEVEEEVEEEENIQDEKQDFKQKSTKYQSTKVPRLESENIENHENGSDQEDSTEENINNNASNLEEKVENSNLENSLEEPTRKDSDQGSVSNYELDNNNNHVVKSKDEVNETSEGIDQNSDDSIINEITQNSSALMDVENIPKNDDDIIDSVLNDNVDSKNSQNER